MRRVAPLLLLLAGCAGPPVAPAEPGALTGVAPLRSIGALSTDFDVEHYRIELAIDAERGELTGRCTVRFFPLVDGLGSLNLDLVGLEATAVTDAAGRDLEQVQFEGKLRVGLPEGVRRGRAFEVVIDYGGRPVDGIWFADDHCSAGGAPDGARGWFPCQDHPADLATVELLLDLPAQWVGAAAGDRIEALTAGDRRHERWRMHAPHAPFRTGFVAGTFSETQSESNPSLHALTGGSNGASTALEAAGPLVGFLADLTGRRYPYARLTLAEVSGRPTGSGAPLGIALVGPDGSTEDLLRGIAGQWFGGLVTCADWSEAWLHDGLTELAVDRWSEVSGGQEEAQVVRAERIARTLAAQAERPRALVHGTCREPRDLFDAAHLGAGGAARLHLSRHVLGDEAFFGGLRRFLGEHAGTNARTTDLLAALAGDGAGDLRPWFEAPAAPGLEVFWASDEDRGRVLLTVNQVHEITDGVPAVLVMPLDVDLGLGAEVRRHRVQLTARRELFEIPIEPAPRWLLADPEAWLPVTLETRKEPGEWRAIAEEAGVVGRRRAVRALAAPTREASGEERAEGIALLVGRLNGDGSASVRAEAARSLGVIGGQRARAALRRAAEEDLDANVRTRALQSLCAVGEDPDLAQLGRARHGNSADDAEAAAAALLVSCADPEGSAAWLHSGLGDAGTLDVGLLSALARVDVLRAAEEAERWAFDDAQPAAERAAATRVLGDLVRRKPDLIGRLGELLRVGTPAVQDAAVDALAGLPADAGARRLLAAFYPLTSTAHQRRRIEGVFER